MPGCLIRRRGPPQALRDFPSCRIDCTSKPWSRFSPRTPRKRSIARTRSRNGIRFYCLHRSSAMNEPLMNRRRLLLGSAALLGAGIAGRLFAAPSSGARLLLVFLRGGYDSTNFLIPYSSSFYYEARPNIPLAMPDPASNTTALALDADWALAPPVRESIGSMYLQRQAAFVPSPGTEAFSPPPFYTPHTIAPPHPITPS